MQYVMLKIIDDRSSLKVNRAVKYDQFYTTHHQTSCVSQFISSHQFSFNDLICSFVFFVLSDSLPSGDEVRQVKQKHLSACLGQ